MLLRLAVAILIALLVGWPSPAGGMPRDCRDACTARNMRGSCAWLTKDARRCLRKSLTACAKDVRQGLPATCKPSPDLPACLTHHSCPFGAQCIDATCQVVPCTATDNPSACGGLQTCQGDKCVVADCAGSSENCPAGFHCEPVDGPLASVSGTCEADDPAVRYCATNTDCITPGTFNLRCVRGRCVRRPGAPRRNRPRTTTTTSSSTTTTVANGGPPCFDLFDCPSQNVCCAGHCRPDPYAGQGICSTLYTPACTLCTTDDDCTCNGIFCDACEGSASLNGCLDPCTP